MVGNPAPRSAEQGKLVLGEGNILTVYSIKYTHLSSVYV